MLRALLRWILVIATFAFGAFPAFAKPSETQPSATQPSGTRPSATQTGDNVHEPTGWVFPETVGPFKDREITRYDKTGANVSAGYGISTPDAQIAVTVYIYPGVRRGAIPDALAAKHFEQIKGDVTRVHPDATLDSESKTELTQAAKPRDGRKAVFRFDANFAGKEQAVRSEVYLFTLGPWFVKYRVSYPAAQADEAAKRIETFMNDLAWPPGEGEARPAPAERA